MKYLSGILFFLVCSSAISQVVMKDKIVLSASDSASRHVTGISSPENPSNAANAGSLLSGELIYMPATGVNQLSINLNPPLTQYVQGMILNFKTSASNTGPVSIQVNGLPLVSLKKNGSFNLDSLDLAADQMVNAIYDGTNFQVLSKLNRKCPPGFVDVNKDFCIEQIERDTMSWYLATKVCNDMNGRLCSQAEWAFACQKSTILSLVAMTNNLEWVDSAGNSSSQCKAMGVDQFAVPGCNSGYTQQCIVNRTFRCCYSK